LKLTFNGFADCIPMDHEIVEMISVMANEQRSQLFMKIANSLLLSENVLFLNEVQNLPQKYAKVIGG